MRRRAPDAPRRRSPDAATSSEQQVVTARRRLSGHSDDASDGHNMAMEVPVGDSAPSGPMPARRFARTRWASVDTPPTTAGMHAHAATAVPTDRLFVRSPVDTSVTPAKTLPAQSRTQRHKHSTPQPEHRSRTLFARLFRSKTSSRRSRGGEEISTEETEDEQRRGRERRGRPNSQGRDDPEEEDDGEGENDASGRGPGGGALDSPTSHRSTPTYRRNSRRRVEEEEEDDDDDLAPSASAVSSSSARGVNSSSSSSALPFGRTSTVLGRRLSEEEGEEEEGGAASATLQSHRTLMEGPLVKLSSHKYWHAKPTFFVLEETTSPGPPVTTRVVLRQFRKAEHARRPPLRASTPPRVQLEIVLSEHDVIVDISDRYIKHGLELFHHRREGDVDPSNTNAPAAASEPLQSLRLSAADSTSHHLWMRVLGSAIARLIDQSKRHYPIAAADHEFTRTRRFSGEPETVQTIVSRAVPARGHATTSAKVMPVSTAGGGEDEGIRWWQRLRHQHHGNNNNNHHGSTRAQENVSRHPETPEQRLSDFDDDAETIGRCSSDPQSPRALSECSTDDGNNNNNNSHDDHGHGDLDLQQLAAGSMQDFYEDNQQDEPDHAPPRDLHDCSPSTHSTCYSPGDFDAAITSTRDYVPSPDAHVSIVSTPSPFSSTHTHPYSDVGAHKDEDLQSMTEALAAATLSPSTASPNTPPERPKPSYLHDGTMGAGQPVRPLPVRTISVPPQLHTFNANGQVFTLEHRYRLVKSIGNGAYGSVIACKDTMREQSVAVKKITNIFDDLVDAKRILREVRLLRHFGHKNITGLLDLGPPRSKKQLEDMYIITELMETDLHQVIYSMQPMSDDHVKYFLYQMLCALDHIHAAGVVHRDMKPSNILLNANCDLKVCDFGLARGGLQPCGGMDPDDGGVADRGRAVVNGRGRSAPMELTEYVVTRWYRAPEIMLNCLEYTASIDVWAVGCIFAEMLLREPLFPGNDYIHQLKLIIKFLGTPKQEDIAFVKNVKALRFLTKLAISKPKKLREVFAGEDVNPLALDLLGKMLIFNPAKRISVSEALAHPYLAAFYDPADRMPVPRPMDFKFDLPDEQLTREALVDLLWDDITYFHPNLEVPVPSAPAPSLAASVGRRLYGMTALAS